MADDAVKGSIDDGHRLLRTVSHPSIEQFSKQHHWAFATTEVTSCFSLSGYIAGTFPNSHRYRPLRFAIF